MILMQGVVSNLKEMYIFFYNLIVFIVKYNIYM